LDRRDGHLEIAPEHVDRDVDDRRVEDRHHRAEDHDDGQALEGGGEGRRRRGAAGSADRVAALRSVQDRQVSHAI
jgi:hypothetical protein